MNVAFLTKGSQFNEQIVEFLNEADGVDFKGVILEPSLHMETRREVIYYYILRFIRNHGILRGLNQALYFRNLILRGLIDPGVSAREKSIRRKYEDEDFFFHIANVNSEDTRQIIRKHGIDLGVVGSHRYIESETLQAAQNGFINIHPGILPDYPGVAPFFWMLYNGETEGGVTLHFMDGEIDRGDIIHIERYPIVEEDDVGSLKQKYRDVEVEALRKALRKVEEGFEGEEQESRKDLYRMPTIPEILLYYFRTGNKYWS